MATSAKRQLGSLATKEQKFDDCIGRSTRALHALVDRGGHL
jgi:hypothetical protein